MGAHLQGSLKGSHPHALHLFRLFFFLSVGVSVPDHFILQSIKMAMSDFRRKKLLYVFSTFFLWTTAGESTTRNSPPPPSASAGSTDGASRKEKVPMSSRVSSTSGTLFVKETPMEMTKSTRKNGVLCGRTAAPNRGSSSTRI